MGTEFVVVIQKCNVIALCQLNCRIAGFGNMPVNPYEALKVKAASIGGVAAPTPPGGILEKDTKVIGIVRHPGAVIYSWLNAPKEFNKEWNAMEEWQWASKKNLNKKEEYNGYEKWKVLTFLFLELQNKFPQKFYLLKYEDLLHNTFATIQQLFLFCNIPWNQQTQNFITRSKSTDDKDPYSVFRNKEDDHQWRTHLNPVIIRTISEDLLSTGLNKNLQY